MAAAMTKAVRSTSGRSRRHSRTMDSSPRIMRQYPGFRWLGRGRPGPCLSEDRMSTTQRGPGAIDGTRAFDHLPWKLPGSVDKPRSETEQTTAFYSVSRAEGNAMGGRDVEGLVAT